MESLDLDAAIDETIDETKKLSERREQVAESVAAKEREAQTYAAAGEPTPASLSSEIASGRLDIELVDRAIEEKRIHRVSLEGRRKLAEKAEARERADELAEQANQKIAKARAAFREFLPVFDAVVADAKQAISDANAAERRAEHLAGKPPSAMPTERWGFDRGLKNVIDAIHSTIWSHNNDMQAAYAAAGRPVPEELLLP